MRSMNIQRLITRSRLCLLGLLGLTLFSSPVTGQVFESGPSDPELFTLVFDSPPLVGIFVSFGNGLVQQNIFDGGLIADREEASIGNEVNIFGGSLGDDFDANFGSEVNVSRGTVGDNFDANSGSQINISGGSVGERFDANDGSEVNISGGVFGRFFNARSGSEVNISGGIFTGSTLTAVSGSDVEVIGGDFKFNGIPFSEPTVTVSSGDTFSGTLADGSTIVFTRFLFSQDAAIGDFIFEVTLTSAELPPIDLAPIVVDSTNSNRPSGLREGQTLTLLGGGELGDHFRASDATLNVEGGEIGLFGVAVGSEVNISGGTVGEFFNAFFGSVVNISGGSVGEGFEINPGSEVNISGGNVAGLSTFLDSEANISGGSVAILSTFPGSVVNISGGSVGSDFFVVRSGSEVNLVGSNFVLDGVPLDDSLTMGEPFTIVEREVTLSGLFADGSPFSFNLNSSRQEVFASDATLTVTLGAPVTEIVLGDVNQDGVIDFSDIPAFIAVLQSGEFQAEADIDLNGGVDFSDIVPFTIILGNG